MGGDYWPDGVPLGRLVGVPVSEEVSQYRGLLAPATLAWRPPTPLDGIQGTVFARAYVVLAPVGRLRYPIAD